MAELQQQGAAYEVARSTAQQERADLEQARSKELAAERKIRNAQVKHCQICERAILANTGLIAHHGYTRPSLAPGNQTRSCYGARELPYEKSCEGLKRYRVTVVEQKTNIEKQLDDLKHGRTPQIIFQFRDWRGGKDKFIWVSITILGGIPEEHKTLCRRHSIYDWHSACKDRIGSLEHSLKGITQELTHIDKRIADWRLVP